MLRLAMPLLLLLAANAALPARAEEPTHHRRHEAPHHPAAEKPHHPPAHHEPAKPAPHPATRPAPKPVPAPAPVQPSADPAAATAVPSEPAKGSNTGMPIPRFASLKTDEVNFRTGPGLRYPIEWLYHRRDLPVEIEREFEVWRLVSDQDGVKGWVHQANLSGRRSFVTIGGEHTMRSDAKDTASAVAILKPGVVGRLRACEATAGWCQVSVGDYRGWLKRTDFYGILPNEAVQPP